VILGVAQVVVNVADLGAPSESLRAAGFTERFAERELPNNDAKRPLQAHARTELDMVHFNAPDGGVAVELTAYGGEAPAGRAAYQLELPRRVSVLASEPEGSRAFWGALGFRDAGDRLEVRAMRPEWSLDVALVDRAAHEPTTVDADGCVLVTLLTTGLDADLERLRQAGLLSRLAPPWEESIDGRLLRVAMAEGPSGELIELLQPPRQSKQSDREN
jgi:hypothetical protein